MARILMRTYGTASFCGDPMTGDCDCAVLDVTPELLCRLRAWGERFRLLKLEESCACELVEYGMPLDVYDYTPIGDLVDDLDSPLATGPDPYNDDGFCLLPDSVDFGKYEEHHAQRTESECLHVRGHWTTPDRTEWVSEFYWSFRPKYGECRVETPQFSLGDLEECLSPAAAT